MSRRAVHLFAYRNEDFTGLTRMRRPGLPEQDSRVRLGSKFLDDSSIIMHSGNASGNRFNSSQNQE
jgi:hypothetical protein